MFFLICHLLFLILLLLCIYYSTLSIHRLLLLLSNHRWLFYFRDILFLDLSELHGDLEPGWWHVPPLLEHLLEHVGWLVNCLVLVRTYFFFLSRDDIFVLWTNLFLLRIS